MAYKRRHFFDIHEGKIVDMSIGLSLENNSRRNTLIAHPFREWFMVRAFIIDLI